MDLKLFDSSLRDYVERITTKSKSGLYNCPICRSGSGIKRTGAFSVYQDGMRWKWKCFSCSRSGDIIDLCSAVENCSISEATKKLISLYGTNQGGTQERRPAEVQKPVAADAAAPDQTQQDFREEIERYAAALEGSPAEAYLHSRGFTLETMRRFKLGYNAERQTVTIPYNPNGSYYGQRSVNPDGIKHYNLSGVSVPLFNAAALYVADTCFVVESPLCAISIEQAGGSAVALAGTSGENRLLTQLKKKPTEATLIVCLDNDKPGEKAAAELGRKLDQAGVIAFDCADLIMGDNRKDPNEVLQMDGAEALAQAVANVISQAQEARRDLQQAQEEARQQHAGAEMVDSFLEAIQSRKYEPIPTGLTDLDRKIGGGLMRQQLVILGGAGGVGKTAFAQWMLEGMAKHGTDIVYINLEMSPHQLIARSLSKVIAARTGETIKTIDILQGYKWDEQQRALILDAANAYRAEIAPHMIYAPAEITSRLDAIMLYLEQEIARAEALKKPAPIVCVDYLHIITSDVREDVETTLKRAVMAFKEFAIKHNTVVLLIAAHNRESNKSGDIGMESVRDTSAIEYSADLQIALGYTLSMQDKDSKSPRDLTEEERKQITMKITKARFGGVGAEIDLLFNGETMTYAPVMPTKFTPDYDPTPFDKWGGKSSKIRY